MFEWNKKTITWFSSAAETSTFHRQLSQIIKNSTKKDSSLISLGCGLGYLEREMINHFSSITYVDNNENAINFVKNRIRVQDKAICADWKQLKIKKDYLLLSFFSRMHKNDYLDQLLEFCDKGIIYVVNERRSNIDQVFNYLLKKNISYSFEKISLEFNQRLKKDEINDFFNTYYSNFESEKIEQLKKNLIPLDNDFLFINKKNITIIFIKKVEEK